MIDDFCLHRVKDEVHVGVEQLLTQNSMWHPNLCFLLYSATHDNCQISVQLIYNVVVSQRGSQLHSHIRQFDQTIRQSTLTTIFGSLVIEQFARQYGVILGIVDFRKSAPCSHLGGHWVARGGGNRRG